MFNIIAVGAKLESIFLIRLIKYEKMEIEIQWKK